MLSRRSRSGTRCRRGAVKSDGEDVLDIVARGIRRLRITSRLNPAWRFVSDTPSVTLVNRVAETYRRTDGGHQGDAAQHDLH